MTPDYEIWITGIIGPNRRARKVGEECSQPVLEVLNDDGTPDTSWPMKLKPEDYGISGLWPDDNQGDANPQKG